MADRELDAKFAAVTRRSHAFTRAAVLAAGGSDDEIYARVDAGLWLQMAPGVFADAGHPNTWLQRVEAARLEVGAAVACRQTAAVLKQFNGFQPGKPRILTSFANTSRSTIAKVHRTRVLPRVDVTTLQGIPSTTPERTVIDLAMEVSRSRLDRLVESEIISNHLDVTRLGERFLSLARRGLRGTKNLRIVLAERMPDAKTPLESELEALLLRRIREAGLPEPVRQVPLPWWPEGKGRVDFGYPGTPVLLEGDGRSWHTRLEEMANDRRRDRAAYLHGMLPFRYTWDELWYEPEIVEELRPLLRTRLTG